MSIVLFYCMPDAFGNRITVICVNTNSNVPGHFRLRSEYEANQQTLREQNALLERLRAAE